MHGRGVWWCRCIRHVAVWAIMAAEGAVALGATPPSAATYGPWNSVVLSGGVGLVLGLPRLAPILTSRNWTAVAWVLPSSLSRARQLIAGYGDPLSAGRYFMTSDDRLGFMSGGGKTLLSTAKLPSAKWSMIAAVAKGEQLRLFLNGRLVARARIDKAQVAPMIVLGPAVEPWATAAHFAGKIVGFALADEALAAAGRRALVGPMPGVLTRYQPASRHWEVQTHQIAGQVVPQPPSTLPRSRAPFSKPVSRTPGPHPALQADGPGRWKLRDWYLASAPALGGATGSRLSRVGYVQGEHWYVATVPGTVLTTLVRRGVYPDPGYGLNNMAIPETLNKHAWWYRTQILVPAAVASKRLRLVFAGINYAGVIWINGRRVGVTNGAFRPGTFDVTGLLKPGQPNVIAVHVSPPPHPGVPNEESLTGGPGENGGMMELDGPTFLATEGWDWIPSVRDRDTGLWQGVMLEALGPVRIGAAHVVTTLPDASHRYADILLSVPLCNAGRRPVKAALRVAFGSVKFSKALTLKPGCTVARYTPANEPKLVVRDPHLWWPNGYGKPYLYYMHLSVAVAGQTSDYQSFDFGIRQISYDLSLFSPSGQLERVRINLNKLASAGGSRHARILNVHLRGILETHVGWPYKEMPGLRRIVPQDATPQSGPRSADVYLDHTRYGFAYSLAPGWKHSLAVSKLPPSPLSPYLVIRVNGVPIALKGGSWGMDDWMKRVSYARLRPYFVLQQKAHLDVIRNWLGLSSEPTFYKLADEYGMLVLNGFWDSTQNDNIEPQDDTLFMRNARSVMRRFRNHPSIALWLGRNEGVPQPLLNQRMARAVTSLDGTRLYLPSSNDIDMWYSGPYDYQPPRNYFTSLAHGFDMEVGSPSIPTLRTLENMMPKADWWPISDDWAYHDWHQAGNGDVKPFMAAMRVMYGKATSLTDFVRKAQMMNYVDYRAIFEGFNAGLWRTNSARLIWMSHSAWPSTMWQLASHDYSASASYFGAREGAEPVHVQMNLPDRRIIVSDETRAGYVGAKLTENLYGLYGKLLSSDVVPVNVSPNSVTVVNVPADINSFVKRSSLIFVSLKLNDANGDLLSRNFYWTALKPHDLRELNRLPKVHVAAAAARDGPHLVHVVLRNASRSIVLQVKLTLVDARGHRILPAYYSDNYIDLVPHAVRSIFVRVPVKFDGRLGGAKVNLKGWNVAPGTVPVTLGG